MINKDIPNLLFAQNLFLLPVEHRKATEYRNVRAKQTVTAAVTKASHF